MIKLTHSIPSLIFLSDYQNLKVQEPFENGVKKINQNIVYQGITELEQH